MLLLLPLGADEAVHLLVLPHARGELGPQVDQGLLAERGTLSSAKGQSRLGALLEVPLSRLKGQGQVLHDEAQHTQCTFSIFALETGPEQKFRDFFAHSPRKASTMAGKENFVTFPLHFFFPGGMASGKLSHTIQLLRIF